MNNPLNSVLIEGNLVKDPVLQELTSGKSVCNFTIAHNRYTKRESETHKDVFYFDVEVWEQVAENCHKYLSKGRGVRVSGRLKQDRWENDAGSVQSRVKVIGDHVEFQSRGAWRTKEKTEDKDASEISPVEDQISETSGTSDNI